MATFWEDIKTQSEWIVKAFGADKLLLDYSMESFKKIDQFFDKHSIRGKAKPKGRLSQNLGPILFSIGAYVGETIIKNVAGAVWRTNDNDPEGEVNAEIVLPDGIVLWPMQRVIKRFKNGGEDGVYAYGVVAIREMGTGDYLEKAKEMHEVRDAGTIRAKKPWWKF